MFDNRTSWRLELGAADGGAIITIEICDVQEYMRNQVDNAAGSLIGRLVLKNFLSRNMVEYLFDEEMRASVLIEQAKQFGKSREDIVEYQFGECFARLAQNFPLSDCLYSA